MFVRKKLIFTFLILCEILSLVKGQEYLKDLKPKTFKFNDYEELPPVELPQPIITPRITRVLNDELPSDDLIKSSRLLQKTQRRTLMDVALEASVREGLSAMRRLYSEIEPNMVKNGQVLKENHPAALLSKFSAPVVETKRGEMAAYASLAAAKFFRKNYDLSNDLARQAHSEQVSLRHTALESMCPPRDPPACMPASERYRTHDGTCNNKGNPRWGAAQMPFDRFLPPEYGDGVDSTRNAVDGGPLSSSRFVSLLVHGAREGEAPLTLMLVQWGQLLDHDLTSTAQPRSINGSVPSCCGSKNFHPSCFPIKVPLDDPWLSPLKVRCLEFLRSAAAQRRDCVLSWREQTNQATSYIDASPIYSSSVKSSDIARVFRKGLLIFGRGNPVDDLCQRGAIATHCIRSGDGRSGEQPGLLALHHVWVHEHNYIAMKLSELNLHWSDEKIYQETRRIIGAMFQHITYREFLPIVLGRVVVKLFDLELLTRGYYEDYDPNINPTVANAFSAAAFRFGHSLVQNSYTRCDRFHNVITSNVSLHEEFQRGDIGSAGSLHRLLRGLATQRALNRDEFITPELTNHLFQTPGFPFGLDLAAINIQRGRDHGIPPYTQWRVPCGLSPINTWEDLANIVGPESARRISHAFNSVHDIDLFVGGIAEKQVVGGLVGPTFACIIAQQFSNSRKGDRFWYENSGFESSFTPAQLHAIRRVSLASVLCRAVGGGTFQPHIFLPPEFPNNERLPCGAPPLSDFDIEPWLEQDPFASLSAAHSAEQQAPLLISHPKTPPTTVKPHSLTDRIFDITQLQTSLSENTNSPLSTSKVSFSKRNPALTLIKDHPLQVAKTPHIGFIPQVSNSFLTTGNFSKINDKLDLKKVGAAGHTTKQKPIPNVNNKLEKNNRKGGNRQNPTRKTIIVNNVPIELRNAGKRNAPEPRTGNADINSDIENTENKGIEIVEKGLGTQEKAENAKDQLKRTTNDLTAQITVNETEDKQDTAVNDTCMSVECETEMTINIQHELQNTEFTNKSNYNLNFTETNDGITIAPILSDQTKLKTNNKTDQNLDENTDLRTDMKIPFSAMNKKTNNITSAQKLQDPELKNVTLSLPCFKNQYDADIDPIAQATSIEHKRVQRMVLSPGFTAQLKDKFQLMPTKNETTRRNSTGILKTNSHTLTTKSTRPSRTTVRTIELRQYYSRPSFTKAPQKVVVNSVNGDNQYQIEINIRQTNKSPKPVHSTPYLTDYTSGYKPSQVDRYMTSYQTTPFYGYYQSSPTQLPTLTQDYTTKRPTIIFVNEPDEHTKTKSPGFVQSIVGWNPATKRPLPASLGFNERPDFESAIGSPYSVASVKPSYQNPPSSQLGIPAATSSFSQAQLGTNGIVQASSSAAVSNGNFGSIAGFASASGTDSTFSFNIRPKPDKPQHSRPTANSESYGLERPQHNHWYDKNPTTGQHISTYDLPYKENLNTPFSTHISNSQKYYTRNKTGGQKRKGALTLTPTHEFFDYEYVARTLQPSSNLTSDKEFEEITEDYEYDEDYGIAPLLRNFNQDGYLRPEHMTGAILMTVTDNNGTDSFNLTAHKNHSLDDNYVLPVLNRSIEVAYNSPVDANFSTNFPDTLAKHLHSDIFAADDNSFGSNNEKGTENMSRIKTDALRKLQRKNNKNRNKINVRNQEKIAFAPLNILTKPERPDNWVFFDSPRQEQPLLPQTPELNIDPVAAAEIPRPFKQNIWLDFAKLKKKMALQFRQSFGHLNQQLDTNTKPKPDNTIARDMILARDNAKTNDILRDSESSKTVTDSNKQLFDLTNKQKS